LPPETPAAAKRTHFSTCRLEPNKNPCQSVFIRELSNDPLPPETPAAAKRTHFPTCRLEPEQKSVSIRVHP
jgi:hypothetical protein